MNIFYILLVLATLSAVLLEPQAALLAAQGALSGWWSKVLPALLPFFIASELLSRLGLIRALSVWLTPVMQPLFRLPGAAALSLLLGFFSGSPTGGAVAADLKRQNLITKNEGERMIAFCNNAGPLYLLITVAALLEAPAAGLWLALVQYPVNLALGLTLRFFAEKTAEKPAPSVTRGELLRQGLAALKAAPRQPFSLILKESSMQALGNIGMIGAFMLCFSLLLLALRISGLLGLLQTALWPLCQMLALPASVLPGLSEGFFEMTLGIQTLSEADAGLFAKVLAAAMILGWSGLSIHAQIAGVCSDANLSLKYYLPCRVIHVLSAPLLLLLLQNHLELPGSTLAGAVLPEWLLLPGLMLLPALLCLGVLLTAAFANCRRD